MGVSQVAGLVTLVPLLVVCAYLSNMDYPGDFLRRSRYCWSCGAFCVGRGRARGAAAAPPQWGGFAPPASAAAPLDLVQHPSRLVLGMGGTVLLTVSLVLCLYTSILAFDATHRWPRSGWST